MTSLLDAPVGVTQQTEPRITLNVLGPLQVGLDGQVQPVGSLRQRRILSMLAVGAVSGRPLTSDELVLGAYGDEAVRGVRRSLSTELWRCRRMLGLPEAIVSDADGYRLDTRRTDVDALRFVEALRLGRAHTDAQEPVQALEVLRDALRMWRGAPLGDWRDHPEGLAVARRLEELRVGGTEDLARCHLQCGDASAAVELLLAVVQEHPHREHAWALLVDAYLALGDRRRAGSAFDTARRLLSDYGLELGVELSAAQGRLGLDPVRLASQRRPPAVENLDASFVGRERELTALRALADRAFGAERPAFAFVAGEPGIGKTALVDRFLAELRTRFDDLVVERVTCDPRFQPQDLTTLPAAPAGVVLVVEDIEWASAEALHSLLLLASRTPAARQLVITTYGACATDRPAPVGDVLSEIRRRADLGLQLSGLDIAATATLLGQDPAEAESSRRATGGNPLYLRQLETGAAHASLQDVLDARIAALDTASLPVLELAAVIGPEFSSTLLIAAAARLADPHPPLHVRTALLHAEQLGLVAATGVAGTADHQFVHGLLRDRLVGRLAPARAAELHAAIAFALDRLVGTVHVSADLRSRHALAAWPAYPTRDAVGHLVAAATELARVGAFECAASRYACSLDLLGMDDSAADPELLRSLLVRRGEAAVAAGAGEEARTAYQGVVRLGQRDDLPFARIEGWLGMLDALEPGWLDPDLLDSLVSALQSAIDRGAGLPSERDLVARTLMFLGQRRAGVAGTLRAAATAADAGLEAELLRRGWDLEPATDRLQVAESLARLEGGDQVAAATRRHAALVGLGEAALADAHELPVHEGGQQSRWDTLLWQLSAALASGSLERVERLLAQAAPLSVVGAQPAEIHRRTSALRRQRILVTEIRAGDYRRVGVVPAPGGTVPADTLLEHHRQYDAAVAGLPGPLTGLAGSVLAADHAEGIALCRAGLSPYSGQHVVSDIANYAGAVDLHLGRLCAAGVDLDAAVDHYRRAREQHRSIGAHLFEAVGIAELVAVLARRNAPGDRQEAERWQSEASRIRAQIGAGHPAPDLPDLAVTAG